MDPGPPGRGPGPATRRGSVATHRFLPTAGTGRRRWSAAGSRAEKRRQTAPAQRPGRPGTTRRHRQATMTQRAPGDRWRRQPPIYQELAPKRPLHTVFITL